MRQHRDPSQNRTFAAWLAAGTLALLFAWIYGRFAGALYFALDDWIETEVALAQPLAAVVRDSFSGALAWSGYRPLTYSVRAALAHAFGLQQIAGYYVFGLGLHLANTLLTFDLVRRHAGPGRGVAWAFLAAAILLLLPAHNEAVLYMSASANLLALFFSLLALQAATAARVRNRPWAQAGAAIAVLLAVLAYEVTLFLPLLILVADWAHGRAGVRQRWPMHAGAFAAVGVALLLRLWSGGGSLAAGRDDYALSLAPLHAARGYAVLLGQMILLHTSAWPHVPLFSNVRDWMSPLNPRALVSMGLTLLLGAAALWAALRPAGKTEPDSGARRPSAPFWMAWGLLWLILMSLPFAALAGRLPENRYTLIPSFGLAVAVAALVAWLYNTVRAAPALRALVLGGALALLVFYAYVDTSDVGEWERAATHVRAFLDGMSAELPLPAQGQTLAQVGVPGNVGAAYLFTTDASFAAAVRLRTRGVTSALAAGDIALRDALRASPGAAATTVLLGYAPETHTTRRIDRALLCATFEACDTMAFAQPEAASTEPAWRYVQIADTDAGGARGLGLLVEPGNPPGLQSCWAFADLTAQVIDPSGYDAAAVRRRCEAALATLAETRAADLSAP